MMVQVQESSLSLRVRPNGACPPCTRLVRRRILPLLWKPVQLMGWSVRIRTTLGHSLCTIPQLRLGVGQLAVMNKTTQWTSLCGQQQISTRRKGQHCHSKRQASTESMFVHGNAGCMHSADACTGHMALVVTTPQPFGYRTRRNNPVRHPRPPVRLVRGLRLSPMPPSTSLRLCTFGILLPADVME